MLFGVSKTVPPPDMWQDLLIHCQKFKRKSDQELDAIDQQVYSLGEEAKLNVGVARTPCRQKLV